MSEAASEITRSYIKSLGYEGQGVYLAENEEHEDFHHPSGHALSYNYDLDRFYGPGSGEYILTKDDLIKELLSWIEDATENDGQNS